MRQDQNPQRLSQFFAETVTDAYNQDVSFLLVGKKGQGKSWAQLSIAYHTALHLAEILGGTWNDYFNLDHVAIIDPMRAVEVITNAQRNCVYIYDDIGVGWNARNFARDENKQKNDIFQINRVDNTVQMFSVPNQFLLDKVPRSLVSHYGEMDRIYFTRGFSTMKLFQPRSLFREGKQIAPYMFQDGMKYIRYVIPAPPKKLRDEYDALRLKITREQIRERRDLMNEKSNNGGRGSSPSPGPNATVYKVAQALEFIELGAGVLDACERAGIPNSTYYRLKKKAENLRKTSSSSSSLHPEPATGSTS